MSLFTKVKMTRIKKNKFNLSHEVKLTCDMTELIPVLTQEIYPGDSFRVKTEILMRFAPMLAPIMHRVNIKTHYFFVPNRLVWDEWEDFITGGSQGDLNPAFPQVAINNTVADNFRIGTLPDYMNVPVVDTTVSNAQAISALPFRAYQLIYNEYFRDQNLSEPVEFSTGSGLTNNAQETEDLTAIRYKAWDKDYFTSALPWAQRGGEASIPIGDIVYNDTTPLKDYDPLDPTANDPADATTISSVGGQLFSDTDGPVTLRNIQEIGATSINELRKAWRLQEWLEKSARGGARYIEQILSHFGVKSSDARLQRPEYLGGGVTPVRISEVLSTYNNVDETGEIQGEPQGQMSGHGIAAGNQHGFSRTFEEHGYVIGIMTVLPKPAYQQGLDRHWSRVDKYDYYWPEFANLGEQEILNKELLLNYNAQDDTNDETFGYQSRYAELKYKQSTVHGDFKKNLSFWHLGRQFTQMPNLNEDFVMANNINDDLDRIFAVEEENVDSLYVQIYHKISALRPMPIYGTPSTL